MSAAEQDRRTFTDYPTRDFAGRVKTITEQGRHLTDEELELFLSLHVRMTNHVHRLLTLWVDKIIGYGVERYQDDDLEKQAWFCFSDAHRKYSRLEALTKATVAGDPAARLALLDAYADLANYSLTAVDVISNSALKDAS